MKKTLSLILVLSFLLCAFVMPVNAMNGPRITTGKDSAAITPICTTAGVEPLEVKPGEDIAQFFKTDKVVDIISTKLPSYANSIGTLHFALYKWNKDYDTTVSGKPISECDFVDFADSAVVEFKTGTEEATGELLLVISHVNERVGTWTASINDTSACLYKAGQPVSGKALRCDIFAHERSTKIEPETYHDAYSKIPCTEYETGTHTDNYEVKIGNETVKAMKGTEAVEKVGFLAYSVDFGETSPKGARLRIDNTCNEIFEAQLVADDLEKGEVLCEFDAELELQEDGLSLTGTESIPAKIVNSSIKGKHVVYLTFKGKSGMVDFEFLKDTPEDSKQEKRLKDFNATKKFTIKETNADTWVATDMLGRKTPDERTLKAYDEDRQVAMFYWTWHALKGANSTANSINQRVIDLYEGPESDIKNNTGYAGWLSSGCWNESIYGTYSGLDTWVLRKQMENLETAGVDALFFDSTNLILPFTGGYMALGKTMHEMHTQGVDTPKMAFILPFAKMDYNRYDLDLIWESMYSIGLYEDCWYYFDGKPVIMAYPESLDVVTGNAELDTQRKEIRDFFTFRPGQADYRSGAKRDDQWPWLEVYPQHAYGKSKKSKFGCECVCVGVAQNTNDRGLTAMNGEGVFGRSYTYKDKFAKLSEISKFYGYNFIEQWDRAFELNPEIVFVTGWNEWRADHQDTWQGVTGAYPDTYNDEYSRDIEPTSGDFKDTYYLLLTSKIREFKGVHKTPEASAQKSIDVSGGFDQWSDVGPEFVGYIGGTEPRKARKRSKEDTLYTNNTGRNDIVLSKVARDSDNLYFYVKTNENMTACTDANWMRLFINADRTYKTGWEGYEFILNRVNPTGSKATLEKWTGENIETDWKWGTVGEVDYKLSGSEMMIKIPKAMLNMSASDMVDIEFKWNDNMQDEGNIMDFYVNGDTAPIGRFAYHYVENAANAKVMADEPTDPKNSKHFKLRKFVIMALDRNYAYVNGNKTPIDTQSEVTSPMIINDKTMVPVRFVSETFGATVDWNEEKQLVTIRFGNDTLRLTIDDDTMLVGKKDSVKLQSPATVVENRTYVPLRDIVENLGKTVNWVDPGLIVIGPELDFSVLYASGEVDKLMQEYGIN